MKIIFISLPSPFANESAMNPPLGICYLSAYLKRQGYSDIELVDFALYSEYDYLNEQIYLEKIPLDGDVYGIYCVTPQYKWLYEISKYIKSNTSAQLIAGGPHPTNCVEDCLIDCGVDIVVKGEGEIPLTEILLGKPLKGIAYLENGKIIDNKTRSYIKDLDTLPLPDYTLIDLSLYKRTINGKKAAHIVTLRGCPYNCAFCDKQSVGRSVRYRSVLSVIREMDLLRDQYGINSFVIYDDIFTLNKQRVIDFCKYFKKAGSQWRCWSRTDTVSYDILSEMQQSGLASITFGVESGSDRVLRRMNKGTTRKQNRDALLLCKQLKIPVRCSLMYGNPGEDIYSLEDTIRFVEETQPDEWNLAVFKPIPGSSVWDCPERYGVSFDKEWLKREFYLPCNRFDDSGVGNIWIDLVEMSRQALLDNLRYFINELERVSPRSNIQDTIQQIKTEEIK